MKTHLLLITLIFVWFGTFAQPQGINYQGVARDSVGHPLLNQNISLRLSILDGSATGSAVYVETQNVLTSGSGLFNVSIGKGNVLSGVFTNVSWGSGDKWLKTEMDVAGGSNYVLIGTTQFLSVPYALYADRTSGESKIKIYNSSGSFIVPQGVFQVIVEGWGGGGGGGSGMIRDNCYWSGGGFGGKGGTTR